MSYVHTQSKSLEYTIMKDLFPEADNRQTLRTAMPFMVTVNWLKLSATLKKMLKCPEYERVMEGDFWNEEETSANINKRILRSSP